MYLYLHCFSSDRLGAWQFMADMPYSSISLLTLWKILWTLYHYQITNRQSVIPGEVGREEDLVLERRGSVLSDRVDLDSIPKTWEEILTDIRGMLYIHTHTCTCIYTCTCTCTCSILCVQFCTCTYCCVHVHISVALVN